MQSRAGSVCLSHFSLGLPPFRHHQNTSNSVPCVIGRVGKQRLPEEALNPRGRPIEVARKMHRSFTGPSRVAVYHIRVLGARNLGGICVSPCRTLDYQSIDDVKEEAMQRSER